LLFHAGGAAIAQQHAVLANFGSLTFYLKLWLFVGNTDNIVRTCHQHATPPTFKPTCKQQHIADAYDRTIP
jgi:hypothetical protein